MLEEQHCQVIRILMWEMIRIEDMNRLDSRETSSDNSDHNEKVSKSVSRYNPLDDNRYASSVRYESKSSSNNEDNIE